MHRMKHKRVPKRVYLDTSAWSALVRRWSGRSVRCFDRYEVLFSGCNLDQIASASHHAAKELARFAWRISNKKRLADHVELTVKEIAAIQSGRSIDSVFEEHPGFHPVWKALRGAGIPIAMKSLADEMIGDAKRQFQSCQRAERDTFRPIFERFRSAGLTTPWSQYLQEMEEEGHIGWYLERFLRAEGLETHVPEPDRIHQVAYRELPATAAGTQYFLALRFKAAQESGKTSRPDRDDQTDFRHAYYAGIVDLYVTEDRKMLEILRDYVYTKQAEILDLDEYLKRLER